ncbi:hypothetical protein J4232_01045 [Candidatus Woesearchaeota archaeon]|nr:hypothetical protein [Candidatus Woesearchaeota archaeon]
MGNGSDGLISLDKLIEGIRNSFDPEIIMTDKNRYRRLSYLCEEFDYNTTVDDDSLEELVSVISEPINNFGRIENRKLAETISIRLSQLFEYAFNNASVRKKLAFAEIFYEATIKSAEFGKNIRSLDHECIAYEMIAKIARFIIYNTDNLKTKYEYALRTVDISKKAITIAEKIFPIEKIARKYSDLANVYKVLAEIIKNREEAGEFAEQWFVYKIKSAELFEQIADGIVGSRMEKDIALFESALQSSFASMAQRFLSNKTDDLEKKIEYIYRSVQCNIHAIDGFKRLGNKEKAAESLSYAAESLGYISRNIDNTETAISYAKMSYEFGIEAAELSGQINNLKNMYLRINQAANNISFIAKKSTNDKERLEYALKAYERKDSVIKFIEKAIEEGELLERNIFNFYRVFYHELYEQIGELAEIIALTTDDISQRIDFLHRANDASKEAIDIAKKKGDALFVQYESLSLIKRKLYLSVLQDEPEYREEAFSLIRDIEVNTHSLESKNRLNILFHMLETEITAYILAGDYNSAGVSVGLLYDYYRFKDSKVTIFELMLYYLEDNKLESAEELISAYKDKTEGQSSLSHIYKPLFLLHIEKLKQKQEQEQLP